MFTTPATTHKRHVDKTGKTKQCFQTTCYLLLYITCLFGSSAYPWEFTTPIPLNPDAATDGTTNDVSPQIATDSQGNCLVAWWKPGGIQVSRSTNNGTSWSFLGVIIPLGSNPRIICSGPQSWIIFYDKKVGDNDIYSIRSTDNGSTWSNPVTVNTNALIDNSVDEDSLSAVGRGADNTIITFWQYHNSSGASNYAVPYVARSTNDGQSWSAPVLLSGLWLLTRCIATDGQGTWLAGMEGYTDPGTPTTDEDEIFACRSTDNGTTWSAPFTINTNSLTDASADDFPDIAFGANQTCITVWASQVTSPTRTNSDIVFARSTNNGQSWTSPTLLNSFYSTDYGSDDNPKVATDGAGFWVTISSSNNTAGGSVADDYDLFISTSSNDGVSWSTPQPLVSHFATDSGGDGYQQIAKTANDTWLVVWRSTDSLGGTIGTDADILISRSTNLQQAAAATPWLLYTNALRNAPQSREAQLLARAAIYE